MTEALRCAPRRVSRMSKEQRWQTGFYKNVTDIEDWSTNRETTAPPPRERKLKGSLKKENFLLQIFKFITSWSLHGGVNP